ncbi:MAG: hypothetical protein EXX96DRAFT_577019 [Benjaminiella poitrasii]|nr:MAG: hypothetical protein EXX96DRAFT_577019 [Benjaminiella poitrasii]
MAQSSGLHFVNSFRIEDKQSKASGITASQGINPVNQPDNVEGWLMNVHTYNKPENTMTTTVTIVDADNNSIPTEKNRNNKHGRANSIASEDSINLDDLIKDNFTGDMDDETDLPDLANLDLDDSTEEFWKLDNNDMISSLDSEFDDFLSSKSINSYDLDWSPSETKVNDLKSSLPTTPSSIYDSRNKRSNSIGSENSLTSQSTITQYSRYGLTSITYPSESSSASSRSLSRQSNYSTASSSTTSGIPLPRKNSSSTNNNNGKTTCIPTPSRSYTLRENNNHNNNKKGTTSQRIQLAKRASHIPAPVTSYLRTAASSPPPTPQRTTSAGNQKKSFLRAPAQPSNKRIPQQRASHIPTVRESIHRPNSPMMSYTSSRIGVQSPTSGTGGGSSIPSRNSLFPSNGVHNNNNTLTFVTRQSDSRQQEEKRGGTPTSTRPSGLRPPGSITRSLPSMRSVSRISTFKTNYPS